MGSVWTLQVYLVLLSYIVNFTYYFALLFLFLGNVYIADSGNSRIRKVIASTGIITTIADGFSTPECVAVDSSGTSYLINYIYFF